MRDLDKGKKWNLSTFIWCFSSVQSLSHVRLCNTMDCSTQTSLSITNSQNLLKFMSTVWVIPSNFHILRHPLLLLPSIFPSIRVFSNEWVLRIRWPEYWSFTFSLSPSSEYSGLISFRMNWLYPIVVQGILKNLIQHHSSKASVIQCSAFFIVQLSHPYTATGKTIASTRRTFIGKVMALLFNMLSRVGHRSFSFKEQVSFNFMAAVTICNTFGAPQNKVCQCFHCFPIYLPWSDGTRCHDLSFLNVEF